MVEEQKDGGGWKKVDREKAEKVKVKEEVQGGAGVVVGEEGWRRWKVDEVLVEEEGDGGGEH